MGQAWYYTQGGQQVGPVDWTQLQQLVGMGRIALEDLVWSDGMPQWTAASTLPGLTPAAPAAAYGAAAMTPGAVATPYGAQAAFPGQVPLNYYGQQANQPLYAGFWLRFVAAIIDGILQNILGFALVLGFAAVNGDGGSEPGTRLTVNLLGFLIGWLYFAVMESSPTQATLGKMALGLKVTDINGNPISFGQASGRYFAKILSALILLVGYMMAGWTERKQALHDMMSGCLVVKK